MLVLLNDVCKKKNFKIYVYPDDHPPPHCHVRFADNSEVSVDIPLIIPRYGATVSKEVRECIKQNLEIICEAYEKMNPHKDYKSKKKIK